MKTNHSGLLTVLTLAKGINEFRSSDLQYELTLVMRKKKTSKTKTDEDHRVDELGELIVELNKLQEYVIAVAEEKISISTAFYESLSKVQLLTERLKNWKERHGR